MSEKEILRSQARRLGVIRHFEEVTQDIFKTCRYLGISRAAFYRWRNRYPKYGAHGLRDRSRRPLNSPRTTRAQIIAKIIYLRERYPFGPWIKQMYLRRYHDIVVSSTGVCKILKRLPMNRLPNHEGQKRYKECFRRYEKPLPGHRIQINVKFLEKIGEPDKKYYQFTAAGDCTRLRVLKVYERNSQQNAMRFVDEALSRLPFRAKVIQTDNRK